MMHSTPTSSPSDWTDSELLSRLLLREGSGWREFHRRYDRLLMRCIQKVMGRFRNVTSAEDDREIYCQLMVNITGNEMKRLRAYDPERGCKLSSWLGMLATHAAWDHLRCVARTPKTRAIEEALAVDCHAPSPFEAAASRERWQQVRETIGTLSALDRRFVQLYFLEGREASEIAEALSISIKTVYTKKHKIRARLEREMQAPRAAQAA